MHTMPEHEVVHVHATIDIHNPDSSTDMEVRGSDTLIEDAEGLLLDGIPCLEILNTDERIQVE